MRVPGAELRCVHHSASFYQRCSVAGEQFDRYLALAFHAIEDRLDRDAPGSPQSQPIISIAPVAPAQAEAGAGMLEMQLHLDRGIFENQRGGLHQNGLAGRKIAHEDVARRVQQQEPGRLRRRETIHEHADRIMRFLVVAGSAWCTKCWSRTNRRRRCWWPA